MDVISVLAQKGGAGKTTLTLHWAVEAERRGQRVAVIDMDTQESSVAWSKRRQQLRHLETPIMLRANEHNLHEVLAACEAEGLDLVLIDTMPRVEKPCVEAAKAAHLSVVPCGPSPVDMEAIQATIDIIRREQATGCIVLNQGRPGSGINEKALGILAQYGLPVCPDYVTRRAALADAFIDGRAVVELDPGSKAAMEITHTWQWIAKQLKGRRHGKGR